MPPQSSYQRVAEPSDEARKEAPLLATSTGWWSHITFSWVSPMLALGKRQALEMRHLPELPEEHAPRLWVERFQTAWQNAVVRHERHSGRTTDVWTAVEKGGLMARTLLSLFWKQLILVSAMALLTVCLNFARVLALRELILHIEGAADAGDLSPVWYTHGVMWAVAVGALTVASVISWYLLARREELVSMHLATALTGAVFDKLMSINAATSKGDIVMLTSTDIKRLQSVAYNVFGFVGAPVQIVLTLVIAFGLLRAAGWSVLAGVIVCGPAAWAICYRFDRLFQGVTTHQQTRLRRLAEVLQGITLIKQFGLEKVFRSSIGRVRLEEIKFVRAIGFNIGALMSFAWVFGPILSVLGFATYCWLGNLLPASVVFPLLLVLSEMEWAVLHLPDEIGKLAAARASVARLGDFLLRRPVPALCGGSDGSNANEGVTTAPTAHESFVYGMQLKDCSFSYIVVPPMPFSGDDSKEHEGDTSTPVATPAPSVDSDNDSATSATSDSTQHCAVRHVSLNVIRGSLLALVGKVGSGKSSLLRGVLGELRRDHGEVHRPTSVAYVPQEAWIRSATIRSNILAGRPFDRQWYTDVVEACALGADLRQFPAGDLTEVGERGITLSGGQKARISLARAVYRRAELYLLDDPLSAVDAHVGRWLFERCIGPNGILRQATRVLVSHQLQWLPQCDRVGVMSRGALTHYGTYADLTSKGVRFASLASELQDAGVTGGVAAAEEHATSPDDAAGAGDEATEEAKGDTMMSEAGVVRSGQEAHAAEEGKLVTAEDRVRGVVARHVWVSYFRYMGWNRVTLLVATTLAMHTLDLVPQVLLASWTESTDHSASTAFALQYAAVTALRAAVTIARNMLWFHCTFMSSKLLHSRMLTAILRAPMSFFHSTPLGRITNRFSEDMNVIDTELPDLMNDTIMSSAAALSTLAFVAYVSPAQILILPALLALMYRVVQLYRHSRRELTRLQSIAKSPVHSIISEVVDGLVCLRSLGIQASERLEMLQRINAANKPRYFRDMSGFWLGVRLQFFTALLCSLVGAAAVFSAGWPDSRLLGASPSLLAAAVSSIIAMCGTVRWAVEQTTQAEAQLSRVERVQHFMSLPTEGAFRSGDDDAEDHLAAPPPEWPARGEVAFQDVVLRYKPGAEPALRGVTFRAQAGERVAIVGRTGAGKSSCIQALFRTTPLCGGSITLDGVDVSSVGVHELRGAMSIIPQDPVLFEGTIRSNLQHSVACDNDASDGTRAPTDAAMWEALERVGLKEHVQGLQQGLQAPVAGGGRNFSVGQRQLLCLARAMLRSAKVLVMDEATASVDSKSDALIQRAVQTAFSDCTVITVAHRLPTVITYDTIVVMDGGRVAEVGSPATLLANPAGSFTAMVRETGAESEAWLRAAAGKA